jgi:hypothetical protein
MIDRTGGRSPHFQSMSDDELIRIARRLARGFAQDEKERALVSTLMDVQSGTGDEPIAVMVGVIVDSHQLFGSRRVTVTFCSRSPSLFSQNKPSVSGSAEPSELKLAPPSLAPTVTHSRRSRLSR